MNEEETEETENGSSEQQALALVEQESTLFHGQTIVAVRHAAKNFSQNDP